MSENIFMNVLATGMARLERKWKGGACSKRLQELGEELKEVEMEQRQEGHGGGCNLVGG